MAILNGVLRPGGSITVIEGDHAAIQWQVKLQRMAGGNALVGRQLYPLTIDAGFDPVRISPRTVYVDSSRTDLVRTREL